MHFTASHLADALPPRRISVRFPLVKKKLKSWCGDVLYGTGLHRPRFRDRAVIVAFHRVRDDIPANPISCTEAEFRAYCDFFERYFSIISLGELLDRLAGQRSIDGCLVITFDDGYRDNARFAAVELQRRGLPACFFVATDLIGSSRVPWWDAEWNVPTEWMDWSEVRALHAAGFEVGGHTRNHVDLGKVNGGEARAEIEGCKQRLEHELGAAVSFFSYPYGRSNQLTEANRELIRHTGFACCLSAFGGTVYAGDDAFRLKRTPISPWFASPAQFGFEVAWHRE